jgi:hypothetical protein
VEGSPLTVRAEGLAELVGGILLSCTVGTPTLVGQPVLGVDFQLRLNTLIGNFGPLGSSAIDALLILDDPTTPNQR